jgi:hypothetical protein
MHNEEQIGAAVTRIQSFHASDRQERLTDAFLRWIEDPIKPKSSEGNHRTNPILILLMVIAVLTGGTFLFFSLVQL